jgi:exonuclease SbcC
MPLKQTLATHQATLARKEAILGAAAKRDETQLLISREEAKLEPLRRAIAELEAKQVSHVTLQTAVSGLMTQGQTKAAHFETLTKQAAVVDQVPCVGHAMHASCPLLSQALQAKSQAEEQRVSVAELRAQYREKKALADALAPVVAELAAKRGEYSALTRTLSDARRDLQAATELAASKPLLDAAATGLETANAELRDVADEAATRSARYESEKARMTAEMARIQAESKQLAAVDVTAAIAETDRKLATNREAVAALEGRIEGAIRAQTILQAEANGLAVELDGFSATQRRADRLSDEVSQWKLLAKGLGNDGVIALTIDDAGPALPSQLLIAVQNEMQLDDVAPYLSPVVGIFIGGSTEWKEATAEPWGHLARRRNCHLHVGRVNSARRIHICAAAGADSFDGSGPSRFSNALPRLDRATRQPDLFAAADQSLEDARAASLGLTL